MTENSRGALLMMAAMAAFTANDTCMKALSGEMALNQALFLRGLMTTLAMLAIGIAWRGLRFDLPRRDWFLIALRTLAEILAAYFFLTALFHMPLANVTAVLQALPLTVTLAGAVFFAEPVGWRRMSAILIGFAGVLLIVRPGPEGFNAYGVMAVASVACVTVRDLATRRLSAAVPSIMVAFSAAAGVMLYFGLASVGDTWVRPSTAGTLQLVGAAVFVIGGYLLAVLAMRQGELSFVTPFRYTGLLWALVLGFVFFGDWPDALTLLGSAIVVATGIFTFWRERRVRRIAARTVPGGARGA